MDPPRSQSVGLIGLGNMGSALASRLATSGRVIGYDIAPERAERCASLGVEIVSSATAVAERCQTIVLSLPNPPTSLAILDELVGSLVPGSLVIETSTITPRQAQAMHATAHSAGIGCVDAAVLSGISEVADGSSCFLVGGEASDIERALPTLARICDLHIVLGPPGAGMAAKVINNAVAHAVMVVLAEAAALGRAADISLHDLCDLLSQPDAGLQRPLHARLEGRYANQDFDGGMSTEAARKDSALVLEMAREADVPLFAIHAVDTVYALAVSQGLARQDYAAIAGMWDVWRGSNHRDAA